MEAAADRTPLMFIHGAWLSSGSWENFSEYFEHRGFDVSAPEWPRKHGDVEELREATDDIEGLGLTEIVDHYEEQIDALGGPPVLIGHSFGGLIVELLLDRGLGRAGVAMSPAPPKGILVLPFSSLKAAAPALAHPSKWHGVVPLTLEEFTYGFVNTFSPEDAKAAYDAVRGSRDRADLLRGGLRELPSAPAHRGALQERRARSAADRRRGEGPHRPRVTREEAVREVREVVGADGLRRVPRSAPSDDDRRGLGGDRRPDRELGERGPDGNRRCRRESTTA